MKKRFQTTWIQDSNIFLKSHTIIVSNHSTNLTLNTVVNTRNFVSNIITIGFQSNPK